MTSCEAMHAAAERAGLDLKIVRSQHIPAVIRPKDSTCTCTTCGASWGVVTDRGGVTRRAEDGPIRRKTWRLCPRGCNAAHLGK